MAISVDVDFECAECGTSLKVFEQKYEGGTVKLTPCSYCLDLFYRTGKDEGIQEGETNAQA